METMNLNYIFLERQFLQWEITVLHDFVHFFLSFNSLKCIPSLKLSIISSSLSRAQAVDEKS